MKRLLLLPLLLAGCASPLTPEALAPSLAQAFGGLYTAQQQTLGRSVDRAGLGVLATCRRTGPDAAGPGEDWTCTVAYRDGVNATSQAFEVQVKPDGCWKAEGAPALQAAELVDPRTGERSTNPLAEFDGCFDTSWG